MIEESSHRQVCDALHRAIVERDQLRAELAAARAEADRLRRANYTGYIRYGTTLHLYESADEMAAAIKRGGREGSACWVDRVIIHLAAPTPGWGAARPARPAQAGDAG